MFYGSYAVAGAFGGLIAYGCFHLKGALYGWQYLFIIEGSLTLVVACVTPFWLVASPKHAWFLNEREKEYAEARMIADAAANADSTYRITKRDIMEGALDWKLWCVLPWNVLASIAPQGFTIFFPLVVKVRQPPGLSPSNDPIETLLSLSADLTDTLLGTWLLWRNSEVRRSRLKPRFQEHPND